MDSSKNSQQETQLAHLKIIEAGPVFTNCYIIVNQEKEAAVIDPADEADRILETVASLDATVSLILCTHGHFDHIGAAGQVHEKTGAQIALHNGDLPLWKQVELQTQMFGLPAPPPLPPPHIIFSDDDAITLGNLSINVRHTPGHSPGSVIYHLEEDNLIINGDTVFAMGVGRTDLWGGDAALLKQSLENQIFSLPDDVVLYPGHGPCTTVSDARRNLAFLGL